MDPQTRIFIAYSEKDDQVVDGIIKDFQALKELDVFSMKRLTGGKAFDKELQNFIAYSQVFVPIISKASLRSGWVHQEIGYAMALNIPVIPIAIEKAGPIGMIERLQAIKWYELADKTEIFNIDQFFEPIRKSERINAPYNLAEKRDDRINKIIQYADDIVVLSGKSYGYIRNKGALSVFAIPDVSEKSAIWNKFFGNEKIDERIEQARAERRVLEQHAQKAGFSILINPEIKYDDRPPEAKKARLEILQEFLQKVHKNNETRKDHLRIEAIVAFDVNMPGQEHLTIMGDYFYAETLSARASSGLRNTLFTRNPMVVRSKIEDFDEEIRMKLNDRNIEPEDSLEKAINVIQKFIDNPGITLIEAI